MSERARLQYAIVIAELSGFTYFAASLRQLLWLHENRLIAAALLRDGDV